MTERIHSRTHRIGVFILIALSALAIAATAHAQCNLASPPCPGSGPCAFTCATSLGGCGAATPIAHTSVSECTGAFDLRTTQYASTCGTTSCSPQLAPPLRFFMYDDYVTANYGCGRPGPDGGEWLINTGLDFGFGTPGYWMLYQSNWQGCALDGCPAGARTVAEISDLDQALEGTINHDSWFVISSVDFAAGSYDFDRVTGATVVGGCGEGSTPASRVEGVDIVGRADFCTGTTIPTSAVTHPTDLAYCQLEVTLREPAPPYFTENGFQDPAVPLIAGYQIVYMETAGGVEPTSSDPSSGWQPIHDATNPSLLRAGFVPFGTAGPVTVTIPNCPPAGGTWLGTRIVYQDASLNPGGTFTFPGGPVLMSPVSAHCGPITCGSIIDAVEFDSVTATHREDGVLVRWSTVYEQDVRGFSVYRQNGPDPTETAVEVTATPLRAEGPGYPYEHLDSSADPNGSYFYYILERTMSGAGDRSKIVEATRLDTETRANGERERKRAVR